MGLWNGTYYISFLEIHNVHYNVKDSKSNLSK